LANHNKKSKLVNEMKVPKPFSLCLAFSIGSSQQKFQKIKNQKSKLWTLPR
jgi:hypothetical protein